MVTVCSILPWIPQNVCWHYYCVNDCCHHLPFSNLMILIATVWYKFWIDDSQRVHNVSATLERCLAVKWLAAFGFAMNITFGDALQHIHELTKKTVHFPFRLHHWNAVITIDTAVFHLHSDLKIKFPFKCASFRIILILLIFWLLVERKRETNQEHTKTSEIAKTDFFFNNIFVPPIELYDSE